jgi:hypothetical protein
MDPSRNPARGLASPIEDPASFRYLPVTNVYPVPVDQAVPAMEKLLMVAVRLWAPGTLRMVFAAGADRYHAGFAVRASSGMDPSAVAGDLRELAHAVAPWLGLGELTRECPGGPLGTASHVLLRGTLDPRPVTAQYALGWPVCARDEHQWALIVDVDGLTDPPPAGGDRAEESGHAIRCAITLHGDGDRRDLIATLLAEDTLGPVGLVADPIRPRETCRPTLLPLQLVGHLLAAPARVTDAFRTRPPLSRHALVSLIDTAPTPHLLVVGASGQGKTTFLAQLVDAAASRGEAVAVVNVHDGQLTDAAAESCLLHGQDPELADFAARRPPILHLTQQPPGVDPASWAAELYAIIRDLLWADMPAEFFGPVLQRALRAALEALIRDPHGARPLHELPRLLDPDEEDWRDDLLERIDDPALTRTLNTEIVPMLTTRDAGNPLIWVTGKLKPLTGDPYLRQVTAGPRDTTGVEQAVAAGRPFLLHAPARILGDHGSRVVVATLLHRLWLAVRRRPTPYPLHLVVDEWQRYPVPTLPTMLTEGRKFGLRLRLANQNLAQVTPALRDTLLGNIGVLGCFRIGPTDAAYLDGFFPTVTPHHLQTLPPAPPRPHHGGDRHDHPHPRPRTRAR